ncbi:MAG: hypothetical protein JNL08_00065 [Planctomycetes bacterium]|nr:hypothetical protein [Planctomycetota bacterium]
MHRLLPPSLGLLFALGCPAQTFVVDANNGPGTNFTTLTAAVAAVPSGSVLSVRAGIYAGVTIDAMSLEILGEPGARIDAQPGSNSKVVSVVNLQPAQRVRVSGFELSTTSYYYAVTAESVNCQGLVCFEDLRCVTSTQVYISLRFVNSDRVLVRDVTSNTGWVGATCQQSNVSFEDCRLGVPLAGPVGSAAPLYVTGGSVQLANSSVRASGGFSSHAVSMQGGELRLLGTTVLTAGAPPPPPLWWVPHELAGSGTVRLDPSVTLTTGMVEAGITVVTQAMPSLRSSGTATTIDAELTGPNSALGAIAVSLPGPRVVLPLFQDAVWLDGSSLIWVGLGVLGPSLPVTGWLPWTIGPAPGLVAVWQGVVFDPATGWQVSNPSLAVLP